MVSIELMGVVLAFLLVAFGLLYTFLRGLGRLSDAGGEIGSRLLTLKGGSGLILVALGVLLLIFMGLPQDGGQAPESMNAPTPVATPVTTSEATVSTATVTISPTPQVDLSEALVGTWSASTELGDEFISLYSDGSFELAVYHYSGGVSYLSGSYALADSSLYLVSSDGTSARYSLDYVDRDTIFVNGVRYTRVE